MYTIHGEGRAAFVHPPCRIVGGGDPAWTLCLDPRGKSTLKEREEEGSNCRK